MKVTSFAPRGAAGWVAGFAVVETTAPVTRTLLPEPNVTIGFRFRGRSRLADEADDVPDAVVTGFRATTRQMATFAESGIVLARLRPGAARAVLGRSLEPLFGANAPLEDFLPPALVARSLAAIRAAASTLERIALVEAFVAAVAGETPRDRLVDDAVGALVAKDGRARVDELAKGFGVSVDTLEKRCRLATGTTPKKIARIVRVRRALEAARDAPTLARAAAAAGYCDESHFVREVKAVTGTTPARFVARADEAC